MTTLDKALALVMSIQDTISSGTGHYNKAGERLETVDAVLRCIRDEKVVTLSRDGELAEETNYDLENLGASVAREMPNVPSTVSSR